MEKAKLLSFVVPVYYEEECIGQFIKEVSAVMQSQSIDYEFIFIDDGSKDNTCTLIKEFAKENSRIKLLEFSYNHGKQSAVTAGIHYAQGDYLLYMDPDLQDPPEEIPRFFFFFFFFFYLVFGIRKEKIDSFINKLFSKIFWGTLNKFTGLEIPKGLAVMRIFNRRFAERFKQYSETNRFIEGLFMDISLERTEIIIKQRERFAGTSKFNFRRKMVLAFNAIFDYSQLPLQFVLKFGAWVVGLSILSLLSIVIAKLFIIDFQAGWPSIISLIILGFGIQIFMLGIVTIYIGKIYEESKRRPLFSIKGFTNIEE